MPELLQTSLLGLVNHKQEKKMKLLTTLDVADIFRLDGTDKQKNRKIIYWLQDEIIPRSTTIKVGRKILFIEEKINEFLLEKAGQTLL